MDTKKPLFHLGIRIGILILLFIGVFIYGYLNYPPNQYPRHLDPKIGFSVLTFILIQIFCLFLLIEMITFFAKKNKNLAIINLTILIIIETPILVLLYILL